MNEQKKCTNCRYLQRYYVVNASLRYSWTCKGRCLKKAATEAKVKKYLCEGYACEQWEPYEKQIDQCHEKIENIIKEMAQKLDDIRSILIEDNEYLKRR